LSRSRFTIASRPFAAASDSGVWPLLSFESKSTLPVSINSFIAASCPLAAAHDRGMRLSASRRDRSGYKVMSSTKRCIYIYIYIYIVSKRDASIAAMINLGAQSCLHVSLILLGSTQLSGTCEEIPLQGPPCLGLHLTVDKCFVTG
jgi:hypothetical protein